MSRRCDGLVYGGGHMPFPVDERYVVLAEQLLGVRLPSVYRQKLLAENGGDLETAEDHWLPYPV